MIETCSANSKQNNKKTIIQEFVPQIFCKKFYKCCLIGKFDIVTAEYDILSSSFLL